MPAPARSTLWLRLLAFAAVVGATWWWPPLWRYGRVIAITYLIVCVAITLLQYQLIYIGANVKLPGYDDFRTGAREQGLAPWPSEGEAFLGWMHPGPKDAKPRGTFVVIHGNGGAALHRLAYADALVRRGYRVLLYEFPGFGERPGTPRAATIIPEVRKLVHDLHAQGLGPVYLWGESLGSGVATAAAAGNDEVDGVVLLTAFDSLQNAAAHAYPYIPVRLLLRENYDSVDSLARYRKPVAFVISRDDQVVPYALAHRLYESYQGPKIAFIHEGAGHNSWPTDPDGKWWDEVVDFVTGKTAAATAGSQP